MQPPAVISIQPSVESLETSTTRSTSNKQGSEADGIEQQKSKSVATIQGSPKSESSKQNINSFATSVATNAPKSESTLNSQPNNNIDTTVPIKQQPNDSKPPQTTTSSSTSTEKEAALVKSSLNSSKTNDCTEVDLSATNDETEEWLEIAPVVNPSKGSKCSPIVCVIS